MNTENDVILSRLAVYIEEAESSYPIGSGLLFNHPSLGNSVYLLTAAHCLYEDKELLQLPRNEVSIGLFNPQTTVYQSIRVELNHALVSKSPDKDVAIIRLNRTEVEAITGELPVVQAIKERHSITSFALKGFPSAARGKEPVATYPVFLQELPHQKEFQLLLTDDFTTETSAESKVDGFSGSGVFLESHNMLYLFGIFTRFREAQKVIYCQYIDTLNELLSAVFLPTIPFAYIGEHGLTPDFFAKHNTKAIGDLGPRFTEEINLRLPIVFDFHDAAKDDVFKHRLSSCVDKWLLHRSYSGSNENKDLLKAINDKLTTLKQSTITWLATIHWEADKLIDSAQLFTGLNTLQQHIDEKRNELYELQRQAWKKKKEQETTEKSSPKYEREPYESELSWLRDAQRAIYTLENELSSVSVLLANSPVLLIKGEPGCGKSHLLGDMTNEALKAGVATLLFLGQHFKGAQTIWQNILSQLDLNCSKEELLTSLNSIGKQQGARVLLMIDALNEGPGRDLWKDALAGFIEDVRLYPFIGLVLTVRNTYFNAIIPKNVQEDSRITYRRHEGFKGNEYEALRLFCEHYKLQMPNFPVMTPEFSRPLFLQLICQGVKASGEKVFPQGFQGISKVFNYYVDAIYNKLAEKSSNDYENRKHVVRDAIHIMAKACFEKEGSKMLSLEEANKLFDEKFSRFPSLLNDLIHENVFIQTTRKDYKTKEEFEMLYFSYERFGDFFIAAQLLEKYATAEDVKQAFGKEAEFGKLLEDYHWRNRGVLEALAVLLPEKYNLELVEVFNWVFIQTKEPSFSDVGEWLTRFFWDSLQWRTPASIDNEKITTWLRGEQCMLLEEEYFLRLVELTTVHEHPFNGDRLFKYLNQHSMPDRDSFWQVHIRNFCRSGDDGNAFPIRRLIDWAWQKGISALVDTETARLAGQTLAWLLASTYRKLRDQTTKAMVNLLENQPQALIEILTAFQDTDDAYIAERLYAVTYGCALRTSSDANLKLLADYIYGNIFKNGNPPVHVLLRDYARNVIEYAFYKGLASEIDMTLVRPPYKSQFPEKLPTKEDVEKYDTDYTDSDSGWDKEKARIYRQIHFDTLKWDFGDKTVEHALRDFAPISFTAESAFKTFKKTLKGDKKCWLRLIESNFKTQANLKKRKAGVLKNIEDKSIKELIASVLVFYEQFKEEFQKLLTPEEWQRFELKFIPVIKARFANNKYPSDSVKVSPLKRWIVQRAFELGYDIEKHHEYDRLAERHSDYYGSEIERIGKKYQWIAFHEMVARLADNFYFKDDYWRSSKKSIYQGPWQQSLRDIDPVFTTKNPVETDRELDSLGRSSRGNLWFDTDYNHWNQPPDVWANNLYDLPVPEHVICRKDEEGEAWVYLKLHTDWKEPKAIGEERYSRNWRRVYYMINAYLIHKKDKNRIIKYLTGKNFFGRREMPETNSINLSLFNRENYWSPASQPDEKHRKIWDTILRTRLKVMVTTSEAVGELSEDRSGAHRRYDMPVKALFEGMGLKYASEDGSFTNSAEETVITSINPDGIMIRMKDLLVFLEQNDYEVIWTLLGEKMAMSERSENSHFRAVSGVYHYDGSKVSGSFFISERS
jgi:hypothetical protein